MVILKPYNDESDTPLMLAAHYIRTPCVAEVLKLGANVHHVDYYGRTALHMIAVHPTSDHDGMQCVQLLIQAGLDPEVCDKCDRTAVELARSTFGGAAWAAKLDAWIHHQPDFT